MYPEMVSHIRKHIENGKTLTEVSKWFRIPVYKLRKIAFENNIQPNTNDPEGLNYDIAVKIREYATEAYFFKDFANEFGLPMSKIRTVCSMYDLKPLKKAYCIVCGKEIDLTGSSIVNKFCSRTCSDRHRRPLKGRIVTKVCQSCGNTFEGNSNSKFCSDSCKKIASDTRRDIKCLSEL